MFCPQCGTAAPDGAAFCLKCGSALSAPETPTAAPPVAAPAAAPATPIATPAATPQQYAPAAPAYPGGAQQTPATEVAAQAGAAAQAAAAQAAAAVDQFKDYMGSDTARQSWWIPSLIGGLSAAAAGIAVTWLLRAWLIGMTTSSIGDSAGAFGGLASGLAGDFLEKLMPSAWAMLLSFQGASSTATAGATAGSGLFSGSAAFSMTSHPGLTLFAVVPFAALALGGWVAARYSRVASIDDALVRGAMTAVPYLVVLYILTLVFGQSASSSMNVPTGFIDVATTVKVSSGVGIVSAVLTSAIWGTIFGSIGALIGFRGKGWFADAVAWLEARKIPFWAQARHAVRALLLILAIAAGVTLLALFVLMSETHASGEEGFALFIFWLLLLPSLAGSVATMAVGGSWQVTVSSQMLGESQAQGFVMNGITDAFAKGMYGLPLLLVAVALWLLVRAGKAAAVEARPGSLTAAVIEGVKVAVPFAALMLLVAFLSTMSGSFGGSGLAEGNDATYYMGFNLLWTSCTVLILSGIATGFGGYLWWKSPGVAMASGPVDGSKG